MHRGRATRTGKTFSPYDLTEEPILAPSTFLVREYIQALVDSDDTLSDADDTLLDRENNGAGCDSHSDLPGGSSISTGGSPGIAGASLSSLPRTMPNPPSIFTDQSPGTAASSSSASPLQKLHKSEKNYKSNVKKRRRRAAAHLQAKTDSKAFILRRLLEASKNPLISSTAFRSDFDGVRTGPCWTAMREARKAQDRTEYTLEEILAEDFMEVVDWDGCQTRLIIDQEGVVVAVLGGMPADKGWPSVQAAAAKAIEEAGQAIKFSTKHVDHRRGRFPALAAGISHGGGQQQPSVLDNTVNAQALDKLFQTAALRRISGHTNRLFQTYGRRLHHHYSDTLKRLCARYPGLAPPFEKSAFAACSVNFGPKTVSFPHRDYANLTWGWCAITALGHFNPDRGGHLVLWDLNLAIKFPPGSTILIPSSLIRHSNTRIEDGEVRYSFAQYSAGGIFRWVENNFQTEELWAQNAAPEETAQRHREVGTRWERGLAMLSTIQELRQHIPKP